MVEGLGFGVWFGRSSCPKGLSKNQRHVAKKSKHLHLWTPDRRHPSFGKPQKPRAPVKASRRPSDRAEVCRAPDHRFLNAGWVGCNNTFNFRDRNKDDDEIWVVVKIMIPSWVPQGSTRGS